MNCSECQEHLSRFIDGELEAGISSSVVDHLAVCPECTLLRDDLAAILVECRGIEANAAAPPNSDALWRRINNLIEGEAPASEPEPEEPKGWFSRAWSFSFSQVGVAVLGIALISSLLTIVGIRNYFEPPGENVSLGQPESPTTFQRLLSKVGFIESQQEARDRRIQEQQAAIEYWNKRVQLRRKNWDVRMQAAFDRNLSEIEQAVNEYTMILQKDPDDQLSEEMLDTALTEKMNLLRQFSEL